MFFEPNFFEGEEKEGFYIRPMMKRAWAAQLEVLNVIDKICKKHNIIYWANFGTLIGAIRHQGFIPWDDDIDIGMRRKDLLKFLQVAKKELPEEYSIMTIHETEHFNELLVRVINGSIGSLNLENMNKYHGCPYNVGVDIFYYDNIPDNKEDEDLLLELLGITNGFGHSLKVLKEKKDEVIAEEIETMTEEEKEEMIKEVENICGYQLDHSKPIEKELLRLSDYICQMYNNEETKEISILCKLHGNRKYRFPVTIFESMIELPFENMMVPVPIGYDEYLRIIFGDYMTPVKMVTHTYPFFKNQEDVLLEAAKKKGIAIPAYFTEGREIQENKE